MLLLFIIVVMCFVLYWWNRISTKIRIQRCQEKCKAERDEFEQFQRENGLYPRYGINRPPFNTQGFTHSDEILDHQYVDQFNNPEKMKDMPYELAPDEPGLGGFVKKLT